MPRSTRRWISEEVRSLREPNVLPFHDILDADLVRSALAEEGVTYNECVYTPLVTLCLFLSQVLDPDHSCRAADRLAGDPPPQALRAGDQQLLRGSPAAPVGGGDAVGPPDRR